MKKAIALLLFALLMLSLLTVGSANAVEAIKADQMVNLVKNFLNKNDYPYEYDDYTFSTMFAINNTMEYANVTIYIYDDMLSVSVDAPVWGAEDIFENMAIFTTLANSEIYYAQFRVTLYEGQVYVSCRSCNLVEDVVTLGAICGSRRIPPVLSTQRTAAVHGNLRRRHLRGDRRRQSLWGV